MSAIVEEEEEKHISSHDDDHHQEEEEEELDGATNNKNQNNEEEEVTNNSDEVAGTNDDAENAASILLKEEDYECNICLRLLFEPVTVQCGHSFCRNCYQSLLYRRDHNNNSRRRRNQTCNKCPTCRSILPWDNGITTANNSTHRIKISVTLTKLLETAFPKEYTKRRVELQSETQQQREEANDDDASSILPIFYLDPMLPRQQMTLNIFEPRYVLMISRCLAEGYNNNKCFGMIGNTNMRQGVEVQIIDSTHQRNGRIHIQVRATDRRFLISKDDDDDNDDNNIWREDGYTTARVQWLSLQQADNNEQIIAEETQQQQSAERVLELARNLEPLVEEWKKYILKGRWQRFPGQLQRCLQDIGPMPAITLENNNAGAAIDRALWVGALINPLPGLGVSMEIRPTLLYHASKNTTGHNYLALHLITTVIQKSIEYIQPNGFYLWVQHHTKQILLLRNNEEPPPAFPSRNHTIKAMIQIMLTGLLIVVVLRYTFRRADQQQEECPSSSYFLSQEN